jgi:hypothetical protein
MSGPVQSESHCMSIATGPHLRHDATKPARPYRCPLVSPQDSSTTTTQASIQSAQLPPMCVHRDAGCPVVDVPSFERLPCSPTAATSCSASSSTRRSLRQHSPIMASRRRHVSTPLSRILVGMLAIAGAGSPILRPHNILRLKCVPLARSSTLWRQPSPVSSGRLKLPRYKSSLRFRALARFGVGILWIHCAIGPTSCPYCEGLVKRT